MLREPLVPARLSFVPEVPHVHPAEAVAPKEFIELGVLGEREGVPAMALPGCEAEALGGALCSPRAPMPARMQRTAGPRVERGDEGAPSALTSRVVLAEVRPEAVEQTGRHQKGPIRVLTCTR